MRVHTARTCDHRRQARLSCQAPSRARHAQPPLAVSLAALPQGLERCELLCKRPPAACLATLQLRAWRPAGDQPAALGAVAARCCRCRAAWRICCIAGAVPRVWGWACSALGACRCEVSAQL
jgi:hypothetical protein